MYSYKNNAIAKVFRSKKMKKNKTKLMVIGLGIATSIGFGSVVALPAFADGSTIVKERRAHMKEIGKNMGIMAKFMKEDAGTAADVKKAAETIAQLGPKITSWFPQGTSMDDVLDPPTGAKSEIWQDWSKFEKIAMNVEGLAMAVATAADSGDKGKIGAALGGLGKGACGACHKPFREKLE